MTGFLDDFFPASPLMFGHVVFFSYARSFFFFFERESILPQFPFVGTRFSADTFFFFFPAVFFFCRPFFFLMNAILLFFGSFGGFLLPPPEIDALDFLFVWLAYFPGVSPVFL